MSCWVLCLSRPSSDSSRQKQNQCAWHPQASTRMHVISFIQNYYLDHVCCLFYLQNRAPLDTLQKWSLTGDHGHIALFNMFAIGHTIVCAHVPITQMGRAFLLGHLQWNNWVGPIIKTLSSYAHPEFCTGPLSSTWIRFGSAKFFCFRSSLKQTSAGRGTRVPPSLYWRNTPDLGGRVIDLGYLVYLLDLERVVVHLVHLDYLVYLDNLLNLLNLLFWLCSVVDQTENYLLTQHAVASSICHTHYFNIG